MKTLTGVLAMLLLSGVAWAGNFTDQNNGVVVDNITGLWWQQQDDGFTQTWLAAMTSCQNLDLGPGFGWRLPNRNELESISDDSRSNPSLDPVIFPNAKALGYWTSTTNQAVTNEAVIVNFSNGAVTSVDKGVGLYVRCVHDAPNLFTVTFR